MRRGVFIFSAFVLIVFPCFVFYLFSVSGSDSGQKGTPPMEFKSWQVDRSDKGTDSNDKKHKSFITSTQTLCRWTASVGYQSGIDASSTSPIDPSTVKWSVEDASHGMKLDTKSVKQNWSGPDPSQLDTSTSFNVIGALTVPPYKRNTSCTASDAKRSERKPVHRGGKKMKFTLKFTAQTEDGQKVAYTLELKQDDIDQIRQEYVDYNRLIPSYDHFTDEDTYDFGHYKKMLNVKLDTNFQNWIDAMNTQRQDINLENTKKKNNAEELPDLEKADFTLNSGYRNPHHNFDHAGSTALLSSHMLWVCVGCEQQRH